MMRNLCLHSSCQTATAAFRIVTFLILCLYLCNEDASAFQSNSHIHPATRSNLFRHPGYVNQVRPRQTASSPLLNFLERLRRKRRTNSDHRSSTSSTGTGTALNMVFTTPSSVIEQASTDVLLDDLIDESVRTTARKTVMMQFDPSSGWIWRRWKGTVFSETWRICIINMIYAFLITFVYKLNKDAFRNGLSGFSILWGQLLSVTTFTLTFFLNQSYALWRNCYGYSRRLQGRLNDLNMTLASHAKRVEVTSTNNKSDVDNNVNGNVNGSVNGSLNGSVNGSVNGNVNDDGSLGSHQFSTYTEPAREVLELMARYTRVFNLLTYASFTGSHRPLLTPQGMRRMVDRGIITESERTILSEVQLPVTQRHNTLLLWMMRLFEDARQAGHIDGSSGFEQQFLEKCHVIRAQYGAIGDELQGRMPLAYAHIVQVLVDVILWMYPFMAFSSGMTPFLAVLGTGLLTMFYQGLFNLAKQFLDPYDNESYGKGEDPLCIDTLIAESNAGSVRWMNGLASTPYSVEKLRQGNMLQYQLPLRGWTIEQTTERIQEEMIVNTKKEAEEAERIRVEETERKLAEEATLVKPPTFLEIEITEDVEELMRGDDDDVCRTLDDENLTMEEALEKMEECTEKVP
mmetsp:Transcript_7942/g.9117  ORF Transcript_7942/g.9117 Transcript_7942/m.9117 type:complete len:629 (+) Transcript_7942:41-1927(+)